MPLTQVDNRTTKGKYIQFIHARSSDSGKTKIWNVFGENGERLGVVEWMARWRKYWFVPAGDSSIDYFVGFEETCLRDIAEFVETETKAHRARKAQRESVAV